MKFKRLLIVMLSLLVAVALFACNPTGEQNGGGKSDDVPTLADLIDYSSNTKYYNVAPVVYADTAQQVALLADSIAERNRRIEESDDEPSVPVKIFINSSPDDIIAAMSQAGLSFEKMDKTVKYLAGAENEALDLDAIVATGIWEDDDDWSFFDDWDYYEKLEDKAEASDSTDRDSDNLQRQKRKIMRQVFKIGMTGDEFGRFIYEELNYAQDVTRSMHLSNTEWVNEPYDEYVKYELSFDTLVYFKAFNEFSKDNNKPRTVQLYGYYYDYDKKVYDTTDDTTFEKQLKYSHQSVFSDSEFLDYINIQRNTYIKSYRYKDTFYKKFYDVHFLFQGLLEQYDTIVYEFPEIEPAILGEPNLKYSTEMKAGMDAGFTQQLILTDHLYIYSADIPTMKAYNAANSAYENVKNSGGGVEQRDEKEMLLNIEQLKIVDYILTKMNDQQLSRVLQYHIKTYSGDMIRNIQSERKDKKLEEVALAGIEEGLIHEAERKASEIKIGRTAAIIAQLRRNYGEAGPEEQFSSANSTNWKGIRPEVKAALEHDYSVYPDGTQKKEAFDNLLIKKKWSCGGLDEADCREGNGHLTCTEDYDVEHQISRFLNEHETVLRYSIGQVDVQLAGAPGKHAKVNTSYDLKTTSANHTLGTYTNGNNLEERTMPDGAVTYNYPKTLDNMTFKAGETLKEAMADSKDKKDFLTGNAGKLTLDPQTSEGGTGGSIRRYVYTFEGWYIDIDLKYKVDENEKVKYDMLLYPGFSVKLEAVS